MTRESSSFSSQCGPWLRPWLFPLGVACIYALGAVSAPEETGRALHVCISMGRRLALPLCVAFAVMVAFNRCLAPETVMRFLGRGSGLKGMLLSSAAGILSMGPIYAWYPLLGTLREKGASPLHLAGFMGCRAVKPALLPVMVAYFGWSATLLFAAASFAGAWISAWTVGAVCSDSFQPEDGKK